jgi:hypothetical protein
MLQKYNFSAKKSDFCQLYCIKMRKYVYLCSRFSEGYTLLINREWIS